MERRGSAGIAGILILAAFILLQWDGLAGKPAPNFTLDQAYGGRVDLSTAPDRWGLAECSARRDVKTGSRWGPMGYPWRRAHRDKGRWAMRHPRRRTSRESSVSGAEN